MFTPDFTELKCLREVAGTAKAGTIAGIIDRGISSLDDFAALLSENISADELKQLAEASFHLTRKRFGYALSLYIPLYYDNRCINGCLYCGFNALNKMPRQKLSPADILAEARAIQKHGFKNILLVAGEHPESAHPDLLVPMIRNLHEIGFSSVSIEIAPLEEETYRTLVQEAHLDGLYIYQETYNRELYGTIHPFGPKREYDYRLTTPERGAKAGVPKIGIGFLLGLHDWREEALILAQHLRYLQKHHWQAEYSISFPRIRNAAGAAKALAPVSDRDFLQLICALRLMFPTTGMSLSTRETAALRDRLIPLGFTHLSAGSSTAPGGYSSHNQELEQFTVEDSRPPEEIAALLKKQGFDPIWKDWH